MAGRGAVLAGLRAGQNASQSSSRGPHPSYVSPLLGQYAQWTMGRQNQNVALPRDPLEFLTGAFGPHSPIKPIGVDEPHDGDNRPQPRRWQYPVAWNMPTGTPGAEGLKLADFQTLRLYSELYSIARACIQLRKDELLGVGWDIGPTHEANTAMRGSHSKRREFGNRRAEMLKFFQRPDPNYDDFSSWFEAVLEDMLVIDAVSVYIHPSRLRGKGVLGSSLAALDLLDGSSIRPLLDLRGGVPAPPNVAYQQYLYGVPRSDYMTMLSGEDLKEMGNPVEEYRGDQLFYLRRNPRSWTPYGLAPIERCIVPVITGLRKQQYQMEYFLEGTIPGMFISVGDPDMTPNQIREFQDTLNALANDQAWKHKIIGLPAGSKVDPQKPPELADQSDEMIMAEVCMAYSVMPMELGILPRVARGAGTSMYSGEQMARGAAQLSERKTLKPDLLWLKNVLFDRVIRDICGQQDMEWRWDLLAEERDEMVETQLLVQQIGAGLVSIDEARAEQGREPWGLEITADPGWATAAGYMPLGAINPDTGMLPGMEPQGLAPNGVPAIPGTPPGSSRSGRAVPGEAPRAGQQRPASATRRAPDPVPGSRPDPPGHAEAEGGFASNARRPVPKAALAELDALRRHVTKGRDARTWEPRWLPPEVAESVAVSQETGMGTDEAVARARGQLLKMIPGEVLKDSGDLPEATAAEVREVMLKDFPADSLAWISKVRWYGPAEIPLDQIDFAEKKSWDAWEEPQRVAKIARKLKKADAAGKHVQPVILIDKPGGAGGGKLEIADGHHRGLAAGEAGLDYVWAFIAKVPRRDGPWNTLYEEQKRVGRGGGEFAYAPPHAKKSHL